MAYIKHKKNTAVKPLVLSLTPTDILQRWHEIEILINSFRERDDFSGEVIFLPLMAWQGHDEITYQKMKLSSDLILTIKDRSLTLKECAHEIGYSLAYVGSSLHGLITAVSYGVPCVFIKPLGYKPNTKYLGFMNHFQVSMMIEASNFAVAAKYLNNVPLNSYNSALERLHNHWVNVRNFLRQKNLTSKKKIWDGVSKLALISESTMLMFGLSGDQLLNRGIAIKNENAELNENTAKLNHALNHLNQALIERDIKINNMNQASKSFPWLMKKLSQTIVSLVLSRKRLQLLMKYLNRDKY